MPKFFLCEIINPADAKGDTAVARISTWAIVSYAQHFQLEHLRVLSFENGERLWTTAPLAQLDKLFKPTTL